ncbi:hypothetical protein PHLGIDRAFT_104562 [Phlebiopsis gigantea 11061_1 CR5-6]|uniref:FAD-binding domain-containing protein n=1 Tax=Phlebiopsis gigantea (strain 11061_1 CR5-6) TaxID=745531 RepID=A0A0C3S9I1_PHLG1|nr:hypothetical protein PHLGIDRAFT_104562 [Phlebiopsis gigantea 11061_1 CR5-6]
MAGATLRIRFIIIGATAAGLASAIALRRAGHDVVLLDVGDEAAHDTGCTVPPNMSKLLIRWGLEAELRKVSVGSRVILMTDYETDEIIGKHSWHEELFKDAGGDMLYMHHSDIRKLLHANATALGTSIVPDARVSSIEFDADERPSVRLASGQVLEGDVVVATDGPGSIARALVIGHDVQETNLGLTIFSLTVPREAMAADPQLVPLLEQSWISYVWLGASRGAIGFVAGVQPEFALQVYVADAAAAQLWSQSISPEQVLHHMGPCEPRLQKLVALSVRIHCAPLIEPPELETWVHPSGHLLILGDAAHPFPPGATNGVSTSVCDAGTLGELFRHLHSRAQVASFVRAFESLRRDPVRTMLAADLAHYTTVAMAPGAARDARDAAMREKYVAGVDALTGATDAATAVWERDKAVFAYDAEDHAAEWWNDWGLLEERATNQVRVPPEKVPLFAVQQHRAKTPGA